MSSVTSPVIYTSASMRRSSVTFTAPSVEFSTGTTPKAARARSTSSNTSAMLRAGTNSVDEPNRRRGVGIGARGAEIGDRQRMLERQRRRQDLAPDGPNGLGAQRARIQRDEAVKDLGLALRDEVREILLPLELVDLEGGATALVEEVEDLLVEVIDPGAPFVQVHRSS